MNRQTIIRKIRCYNKNIKDSFFNDKTDKELLSWLHPNDRKEADYNSVYGSKYENIFFNPSGIKMKERW